MVKGKKTVEAQQNRMSSESIHSVNPGSVEKDKRKQSFSNTESFSWKDKQKMGPRVKDGITKQAFLKSNDAIRMSRKALKEAKQGYKLSRKNYRNEKKKFKQAVKDGNKPLSINHMIAKKNYIENKRTRKINQRIYQKTKARDHTRLGFQVKQSAKIKGRNTVLREANEDDILQTGLDTYNKARDAQQKMRMSLRLERKTAGLAVKMGKGTYGLGNRLYNFSRRKGFYRTPPDFTVQKKLMNQIRNRLQRAKAAKNAKEAEKGVGLLRSVMNGEQSIGKAIQLVLKNPYTWAILGIIVVFFMFTGIAAETQKPAIVQDDEELTDSWLYMTKLDAENSDETNQFYSIIDDVMFYMNYRFNEYKLTDMLETGLQNYEGYLSELWTALNGEPPDYSLTSMSALETDEKSEYYFGGEEYEHYQEIKKELGYSTLDDPLAFPFETDSLIISRRYGYEKQEKKETLFTGIEVLTEENQEFNSPLSGKVVKIPNETSLVIEQEKNVRLTIEGVKSNRFKGNEDIQQGSFLGNALKETVILRYEKYGEDKKEWYSVNPAFYFPNVTYTQTTVLGSSDFSPGADVEGRARAFADYALKKGYKLEGIAAMLGSFDIESLINPKRAEGDYLNPPVGASSNSWDDPMWLAMGGPSIYGKYPNILHRGLGLGQWTDTADGSTRHTLLLNYAKSKKKKWYDLQVQLDFIFEGDSPAYRTMASNTAGNKVSANVSELTVYFLNNWEGNPGDKVSERIQSAQNWFNFLSNSGGEVDGSSNEVFKKYKDKMKPVPTDKETKAGQGWAGNAYTPGNCTWYVYNRMKQLGKSINPVMGNGNQWILNYRQTPGASLVSTPKRGDAVIFTNGVAGSSAQYGHVAFVEYVNSDGSFVISEMNVSGVYTMGWRVLKKEAGEYFMRVQ